MTAFPLQEQNRVAITKTLQKLKDLVSDSSQEKFADPRYMLSEALYLLYLFPIH